MKKFNIAIFASGSGSNAEQIFTYFKNHPTITVSMLLSNNAQAFALERADRFNIPTKTFTKQQFRESEIVLKWLHDANITHVVLAGFLWLVPDYLIKAFPNKIINIHPALLPRFGGAGMYGMKVHQAIKDKGETETGITIHEVNEHYDEGKIVFQASCKVDSHDTPEQIANKVHQLEYAHYPVVIEKWINSLL
ncbi:MAG TPA: phosphoribosylglycinamide formyltransferase [Cyclobacteriaceae bacterium]